MAELIDKLAGLAAWLTTTPQGLPYLLIGVLGFLLWQVGVRQRRHFERCEAELFVVTRAFVKTLSLARTNAGKRRERFSEELDRIEDDMLAALGKRREDFEN